MRERGDGRSAASRSAFAGAAAWLARCATLLPFAALLLGAALLPNGTGLRAQSPASAPNSAPLPAANAPIPARAAVAPAAMRGGAAVPVPAMNGGLPSSVTPPPGLAAVRAAVSGGTGTGSASGSASKEAHGAGDLLGPDPLRALTGGDPSRLATPLRILALLTVLTLVPSIVLLATCFPRIVIVLSFVRRALGTQELPPNQILIGLALFLTAMIMAPVWEEVHRDALVPYQAGTIGDEEALERALAPLKRFMADRTLRSDLRLFVEVSGYEEEAKREGKWSEAAPVSGLPLKVLLPAFSLSELKVAFQMGFVLYLPFVIIDLIVATALISMGMLVLPPILISLPLKVLVFVLVDGWRIVVQELVRSFV